MTVSQPQPYLPSQAMGGSASVPGQSALSYSTGAGIGNLAAVANYELHFDNHLHGHAPSGHEDGHSYGSYGAHPIYSPSSPAAHAEGNGVPHSSFPAHVSSFQPAVTDYDHYDYHNAPSPANVPFQGDVDNHNARPIPHHPMYERLPTSSYNTPSSGYHSQVHTASSQASSQSSSHSWAHQDGAQPRTPYEEGDHQVAHPSSAPTYHPQSAALQLSPPWPAHDRRGTFDNLQAGFPRMVVAGGNSPHTSAASASASTASSAGSARVEPLTPPAPAVNTASAPASVKHDEAESGFDWNGLM